MKDVFIARIPNKDAVTAYLEKIGIFDLIYAPVSLHTHTATSILEQAPNSNRGSVYVICYYTFKSFNSKIKISSLKC